MKKISIIVPAHDEEKRISVTLDDYLSYFEGLVHSGTLTEYEILVVINKTTDRTKEIVEEYQKLNVPLKYLDIPEGGKGLAIMRGFQEALKDKQNSLIGFVDADDATTAKELYNQVSAIGDYDGVIASRYLPGAVVSPKQSLQRIIVSRIYNKMTHCLFPNMPKYQDTQCGCKIFKRHVVESIISKIGTTQWGFDFDLLYQIDKAGFKIKEEPTIWSDKLYSKINLKRAGPRMALAILRLRLNNSRFKFVADFYDSLPIWLKISHLI